MEKLLKPQEVAEILGIQLSTVYNWTHYKKIPHVKVGGLLRFKRTDIEKWLSNPLPVHAREIRPRPKAKKPGRKNVYVDALVEQVKGEVLG